MTDVNGVQIVLKCTDHCGDIFESLTEGFQHVLDLSTEDEYHGQFELIPVTHLTDQEKANLAQKGDGA